MKISIVGVGKVGSALGLVLVAKHLADELVLVGREPESASGAAMDLLHATAVGKQARVRSGGLTDTSDSDVVVVCIGSSSLGWPRSAGLAAHFSQFERMIPQLVASSPNAILIIVTNPVDALTTLAGRISGLPAARVIGTGTLLDTMRLRIALSDRCGIAPRDIRTYVLGEHGDSQFAAFSSASIGGGRLAIEPQALRQIEADARQAGCAIMKSKGYTDHGIALATAEIIQAIVKDSREIMPLSVAVEGFCGVSDVCLSLPVVVGREGASRQIAVELSADEAAAFRQSAGIVKTMVDSVFPKPPQRLSVESRRRSGAALHADYSI